MYCNADKQSSFFKTIMLKLLNKVERTWKSLKKHVKCVQEYKCKNTGKLVINCKTYLYSFMYFQNRLNKLPSVSEKLIKFLEDIGNVSLIEVISNNHPYNVLDINYTIDISSESESDYKLL